MSILSNYVPECLVEASLEAPVAALQVYIRHQSGRFVRRSRWQSKLHEKT